VKVAIVFNEPLLPADHPDYAQEAGVLEAVEAVEVALAKTSHRAARLSVRDPLDLAGAFKSCHADVIVNLFEGLAGMAVGEWQATGLLELSRIPFTGSTSDCLSLVCNKARAKWLLAGAGLPTAAFQLLTAGEPVSFERFEHLLALGPVIVKPAREDASLGIGPDSVVTEPAALAKQIDAVRARYGDVLVEQFIAGREFNVGIVGLPEPVALPLAEIEFLSDANPWRVVTYDAKWTPDAADYHATPARCPAAVDDALGDEIREVSLAAFRLLGCRDYARVDLRVDGTGRPYILEINANPDISPSAGLARAVRASGMDYDDFIVRLVETAASRGEE
jgi:D-alanine-D-alanine ligase